MSSETSPERFLFRARATPSCASACVKIQFHVHREERETSILTVAWRHRSWMKTKNKKEVCVFFYPHRGEGTKKPGETRLNCVFGALFRYARTFTCITVHLHLHVYTCIYMSKDRSRCSPDTVKKSIEDGEEISFWLLLGRRTEGNWTFLFRSPEPNN